MVVVNEWSSSSVISGTKSGRWYKLPVYTSTHRVQCAWMVMWCVFTGASKTGYGCPHEAVFYLKPLTSSFLILVCCCRSGAAGRVGCTFTLIMNQNALTFLLQNAASPVALTAFQSWETGNWIIYRRREIYISQASTVPTVFVQRFLRAQVNVINSGWIPVRPQRLTLITSTLWTSDQHLQSGNKRSAAPWKSQCSWKKRDSKVCSIWTSTSWIGLTIGADLSRAEWMQTEYFSNCVTFPAAPPAGQRCHLYEICKLLTSFSTGCHGFLLMAATVFIDHPGF